MRCISKNVRVGKDRRGGRSNQPIVKYGSQLNESHLILLEVLDKAWFVSFLELLQPIMLNCTYIAIGWKCSKGVTTALSVFSLLIKRTR